LNQITSLTNTAESLRNRILKHNQRSIRLASLLNTSQTTDIGRPIILDGYGRIHCFSELEKGDWITDPLPTIPASKRLKCNPELVRNARVLQLSACNLRCWYCFVDYDSLSPDSPSAKDYQISDIISSLTNNSTDPFVLDLSGGNPGLVPEWVWWTIKELQDQDIENVYVWVDDNLTVNFYSKYLSQNQIREIADYPRFGSVGCFKGFDDLSFSFNTGLVRELFNEQFAVFKDLLSFGWDIYGYVTFTTDIQSNIRRRIALFIDKLQDIDENLPLRVIPLEIKPYTPTRMRMNYSRELAIKVQYEALNYWNEEIIKRFPSDLINQPICDITYMSRGKSSGCS